MVLAGAAVCQTASAQTRPPKTVLTIHWGAEDFPGTPTLDAALREALQSKPDSPVNYFVEYLETEAFPKSAQTLRDYIRQKYQGRRIDVVIANTTPSLQFALTNRHELFPGASIVFLAGAIPTEVTNHQVARVTGIISDAGFAETLELALKLQPATRRVFVVSRTPADPDYPKRVRAALSAFSGRVELTFLHEVSVPRLLYAIQQIPAGSLILYTRYTPDDADSVADTVEVARLMAQVSPVPIYGTTSLYMGTGVVGGMMRSSKTLGARLGEMAHQILEGARPEAIPVEKAERVPTFDWRQVRRWGIDPSLLPQGSDIHFRTQTAWEAYRWHVIGAIAVVAAQLLLIAGLLTQRAKRRRAEKTILAGEATLRTSYERIRRLAGRLINAQEAARAGIAQDLHDDICQRLVYVSMAVSTLKSSSGDIQDPHTQRSFEEVERDTMAMFDGLRRLSHELHPASLRVLGLVPALKAHCVETAKRHGVAVDFRAVPDIAPLPAEAAVSFFRIAQEAIRNGIVHGGATRFAVTLVQQADELVLTVADDGRGFDLEAVRQAGGGLGLVSMEERAHLFGGKLEITSAPDAGTTIRARGPVAHATPVLPAGRVISAEAEIPEKHPVGRLGTP
jgi:signal transduction histidine kinase